MQDVRQQLPRMRARARSLTRSREDAEDLVQDTLLVVLSRPRMITGDVGGYLLRALRNTWISNHRQACLRPVCEPLNERELRSVPDPSDPTLVVSDNAAWEAVNALATPYREVVVAVVLCGLSYRQAAHALNVPIGTIMSRLHRARHILQNHAQAA